MLVETYAQARLIAWERKPGIYVDSFSGNLEQIFGLPALTEIHYFGEGFRRNRVDVSVARSVSGARCFSYQDVQAVLPDRADEMLIFSARGITYFRLLYVDDDPDGSFTDRARKARERSGTDSTPDIPVPGQIPLELVERCFYEMRGR